MQDKKTVIGNFTVHLTFEDDVSYCWVVGTERGKEYTSNLDALHYDEVLESDSDHEDYEVIPVPRRMINKIETWADSNGY